MTCACGLGPSTETCCLPIIRGELDAPTPERLMRARYTAYTIGEIDFIMDSLHPDGNSEADRESSEAWANSAEWQGLEILDTKEGGENDEVGEVEFVAKFMLKGRDQRHHERGVFKRHNGKWKYLEGEEFRPKPVVREGPRVGRNDPCTCGSGKKFKKCCGRAA